MQNPTVQRIQFGKVLSAGPSECCGETGYVMGLGQKPKGARGFLSAVPALGGLAQGDPVYRQLMDTIPNLRKHSLRTEDGPYADVGGAIALFAEALTEGVPRTDLYAIIERLIDTRPAVMGDLPTGQRIVDLEFEQRFPRTFDCGLQFRLDSEFPVPDVLTTAGRILTQTERHVTEQGTGADLILQPHSTEPYILAVAVLRHLGYEAYPAQAVIPNDMQTVRFQPIVAVIDFDKEYPLTTFDLLRYHTPMGSVDIVSDVAMLGATFAALAEARVKHLTVEMLLQYKEGKELSFDELQNQLNRVAHALFEAHTRWPGCHYISNTLLYAYEDFANTLFAIDQGKLGTQMAEANRTGTILGFDPHEALANLAAQAKETAGRFTDHIRTVLGQKIDAS
ncbi:Uncharacterised protein [Candidatus Bilamarchaeum dharawalense]|uniref:Uncharacterized protein n=1 Tax=Candidatus Bilamarchaeum dharawalense TaxID=2885759 RepID=A0A5E4LWX9_9ARCH|nr:Uncharacterised protein [Candidatus Bilamarchaeum dharawalense]